MFCKRSGIKTNSGTGVRSQVLSKQDKSFSHLNSVQEEKKGPAESSGKVFISHSRTRHKKKIKTYFLQKVHSLQFLLKLTHLDY